MSLKEALKAASVFPLRRCAVCTLLLELPGEDSEALQVALDSEMPHMAISRALRAEGYDIGRDRIATHRKGDCKPL